MRDIEESPDNLFEELARSLMRDTIVFRHNAAMHHVEGVARGEAAVLGYLTFHGDGVRAGELTEMLGFGSSRTAAILNALEKKGLARRSPDPDDGRQVLVHVTDEGRASTLARRAEATRITSRFLEALGEDDARELTRIVAKAARIQEQSSDFPSHIPHIPHPKGPSPS